MSDEHSEFVAQITQVQRDLYACILTLLPNASDADDVLQEVNRVLWSKRSDFVSGTNFRSWAFSICRFQIMAQIKRMQRDRLCFDSDLVETMTEELSETLDRQQSLRSKLATCLAKLSPKDAQLMELRYATGLRVKQIAQEVGRSGGAIRQALFRIRHSVLECLKRQKVELET